MMNNQGAVGREAITSGSRKNLILLWVRIGINNDPFNVHDVKMWRLLKLG
jgi:hypothetical protein